MDEGLQTNFSFISALTPRALCVYAESNFKSFPPFLSAQKSLAEDEQLANARTPAVSLVETW